MRSLVSALFLTLIVTTSSSAQAEFSIRIQAGGQGYYSHQLAAHGQRPHFRGHRRHHWRGHRGYGRHARRTRIVEVCHRDSGGYHCHERVESAPVRHGGQWYRSRRLGPIPSERFLHRSGRNHD